VLASLLARRAGVREASRTIDRMDDASWPPPPGRPAEGRRLAPFPTLPPPPGAEPPPPHAEPRRRRTGRIVLAAVVAAALLATALGTLGGGGPARHLVASDGAYKFLRVGPGGVPIRWNPCAPIRYEVNVTAAPSGALEDVRQAVARVASATGDRFVYVGTTSRTADDQIGRAFQTGDTTSRWFPLLITWVPHAHFDYLADTTRAAAFGMPQAGDGADAQTYESGVVAMDAGGRLPIGFAGRYSDGVVLMHELGHVMGLAHVADGNEVMWSPTVHDAGAPNLAVSDWGPGDLDGLRILGRRPPSCPSGG
jgi:hypothetical protein